MQIIKRKDAIASGMKTYFNGRPCKFGNLEERWLSNGNCLCSECKDDRSLANKAWRESNPEKVKALRKAYFEKNRDEIYQKNTDWRQANSEQLSRSKSRYYRANAEKLKAYIREWRLSNPGWAYANHRRRLIEDEDYRSAIMMRGMVRRVHALAQTGESTAFLERRLGYKPSEFKSHIERQFTKGMTWENYGEWEIDHITPVSAMVANGIHDPKIVNCLTNLRPLWKDQNRAKSAEITHLI